MITCDKTIEPLGYTCGTCGRVGHNARGCTNRDSMIDKVGIEIEGYWDDLYAAKDRARALGIRGCHDGSLDGSGAWEFQTIPGTVGKALDQLVTMYPDRTNSAAGLHVHVSFKDAPIAIGSLATPEFFAEFDRKWRAWGTSKAILQSAEFWKRLNGENQYCGKPRQDMFYDRTNIVDMNRYNQLNFSAWNEHQTVECRLLPLFRDLKLAVSAVQLLVDMFDDWVKGPGMAALAANVYGATFSAQTLTTEIYGEAEIEIPPPVSEAFDLQMDTYATPEPDEGMKRIPRASVPRVLGL